jgi:hypothetical protein
MPIKWDPTLVREALDRMDALLQEAYPALEAASKEGKTAAEIPGLPQYVTQPLGSLVDNLRYAVDRCRRQLEDSRRRLPTVRLARSVATRDRPGLF